MPISEAIQEHYIRVEKGLNRAISMLVQAIEPEYSNSHKNNFLPKQVSEPLKNRTKSLKQKHKVSLRD